MSYSNMTPEQQIHREKFYSTLKFINGKTHELDKCICINTLPTVTRNKGTYCTITPIYFMITQNIQTKRKQSFLRLGIVDMLHNMAINGDTTIDIHSKSVLNISRDIPVCIERMESIRFFYAHIYQTSPQTMEQPLYIGGLNYNEPPHGPFRKLYNDNYYTCGSYNYFYKMPQCDSLTYITYPNTK